MTLIGSHPFWEIYIGKESNNRTRIQAASMCTRICSERIDSSKLSDRPLSICTINLYDEFDSETLFGVIRTALSTLRNIRVAEQDHRGSGIFLICVNDPRRGFNDPAEPAPFSPRDRYLTSFLNANPSEDKYPAGPQIFLFSMEIDFSLLSSSYRKGTQSKPCEGESIAR